MPRDQIFSEKWVNLQLFSWNNLPSMSICLPAPFWIMVRIATKGLKLHWNVKIRTEYRGSRVQAESLGRTKLLHTQGSAQDTFKTIVNKKSAAGTHLPSQVDITRSYTSTFKANSFPTVLLSTPRFHKRALAFSRPSSGLTLQWWLGWDFWQLCHTFTQKFGWIINSSVHIAQKQFL